MNLVFEGPNTGRVEREVESGKKVEEGEGDEEEILDYNFGASSHQNQRKEADK